MAIEAGLLYQLSVGEASAVNVFGNWTAILPALPAVFARGHFMVGKCSFRPLYGWSLRAGPGKPGTEPLLLATIWLDTRPPYVGSDKVENRQGEEPSGCAVREASGNRPPT